MDLKINCSNQEARRILFMLIAIEIGLILVYVLIHISMPDVRWGPIRKLTDLDLELSFPSWFSSIQLFVVAILLFVASRNNQRKQQVSSYFLTAGSLVFVLLSADEGIAIHERITIVARKLDLNWLLLDGVHGAWIIVYFIIAFFAIIVSVRHFYMLWRYFRRETRVALFGAIVFVTGAVGFEIISYLFLRLEPMSNLYKVEIVCEELLEMSGISIILYAALLFVNTISTPPALSMSEEITEQVQPSELRSKTK